MPIGEKMGTDWLTCAIFLSTASEPAGDTYDVLDMIRSIQGLFFLVTLLYH